MGFVEEARPSASRSCLRSEAYGDLWLVPAYTGQPRKEITPEHAATVMRVLSVFPGSPLSCA